MSLKFTCDECGTVANGAPLTDMYAKFIYALPIGNWGMIRESGTVLHLCSECVEKYK